MVLKELTLAMCVPWRRSAAVLITSVLVLWASVLPVALGAFPKRTAVVVSSQAEPSSQPLHPVHSDHRRRRRNQLDATNATQIELETYTFPRLFNVTYKSVRAAPMPGHHKQSATTTSRDTLKNVNIIPHFAKQPGHTGYKWMPENGTKSRPYRTTLNDAVSRNISIILENLLKNYENSQLPTHGKGTATVVKTNILIRSFGPVSEIDMDFSMDCYFRQYWRDDRLRFRGPIKSLSLSIKMLERIWKPDTYFYNGKHSHIHTITVPNKLLRLSQDGDILYSMRLTIKASCPMQLQSFPMDRQTCPLILGSYAYTNQQLVYEWQDNQSVNFVPGMALSQFDLISFPQRNNSSFVRREGEFSVLQVSFNLQRHTGYFLIQVYVPCILIVVLSWVSFWIHREATSDRVGLGITTVLTLSTISLDSRTDLPKVKYALALDWFLLMCFFYCIATLLEFAGVHYFTKVGSGEIPLDEDEWEDVGDVIEEIGGLSAASTLKLDSPQRFSAARRRSSLICPIYNDLGLHLRAPPPSHATSHLSTMERQTQTDAPRVRKLKQLWLCFVGDEQFRKQRQRDATVKGDGSQRHINSVSLIDRIARVVFPMSFGILNLTYWLCYYTFQADFPGQP